MFRVIISDTSSSLSGKTLIIPAVSVGAVPTLALDLLLNSNQSHKLGWVYTNYFYPYVSQGALDSNSGTCHPIELYSLGDNYLVLQIRSICKNSEDFTSKLSEWCSSTGISNLIVAASNLDEIKASDSDPELFYSKNEKSSSDWPIALQDFTQVKEFLKGAGLSKRLYKLDLAVTLLFVYGKDTPADVQAAYNLASGLQLALNLQGKLQQPQSWHSILVN